MVYGWRDFVERGGLLSYGPDIRTMVRKAAIEALRSQLAGVAGAERPRLPIHRYSRIDDVVRNRE